MCTMYEDSTFSSSKARANHKSCTQTDKKIDQKKYATNHSIWDEWMYGI